MDWIREHLQLVFLAVVGLVSLLKTMWEAKQKREEGGEIDWQPREPVPLDEDDSYRKRAPSVPPPLPREDAPARPVSGPPPLTPGRAQQIPARRNDPARAAAEAAAREEAAALLKHQQDLAARLQQIRDTKATTSGDAAATRKRVAAKKKGPVVAAAPQGLKARLKDRSEIRRAIILREILDRPLGLR